MPGRRNAVGDQRRPPADAGLDADPGLDEVFVLALTASAAYGAPGDWRARVERRLRVASTRRCLAEAREVQLRGAAITVLGPGPEDLQLMGYNLTLDLDVNRSEHG